MRGINGSDPIDLVLANTFGIGALSFGLLLGQALVAFGGITIEVWRAWFYGIGIAVLFLLVASLNIAVWYGALLTSPASQQEGGFLRWCSNRPLRLRAVAALLLTLLPIGFLIAER